MSVHTSFNIHNEFVSNELTDPVMKEHKFYIKLIINYILIIFVIKIH